MLNLLRYASKKKYMAYVKAFGESLSPRFGGIPKIVGEVVHPEGEESGWDGIALVQYPSITHFADLLASDELARIDRKYKVGALKDTGLLCVVEIDIQEAAIGPIAFKQGTKPNAEYIGSSLG